MTEPKKLSRRAVEEFEGARWNAFVEFLAMSEPEGLTPTQRVADLAFWYSNEVLNGGHEQYFVNKEHFDHDEVVSALAALGAECQADVLRRAWGFELRSEALQPDSSLDLDQWLKEYDRWNEDYGYSRRLEAFDHEFGRCRPTVEVELLERYLDAHESDFIKWVEPEAESWTESGREESALKDAAELFLGKWKSEAGQRLRIYRVPLFGIVASYLGPRARWPRLFLPCFLLDTRLVVRLSWLGASGTALIFAPASRVGSRQALLIPELQCGPESPWWEGGFGAEWALPLAVFQRAGATR